MEKMRNNEKVRCLQEGSGWVFGGYGYRGKGRYLQFPAFSR